MSMPSAPPSRLVFSIEGACARIRLSHPPLNVIDRALMAEMLEAFVEIEQHKKITTILFSGSPQSFSAGVDIAAHAPDQVKEMLHGFHGLIKRLATTQKLTIAAVRGRCLGGGAELAMMCDLVYTSQESTWQFPEIKLGCYPPVACVALAAIVGQKRAAEMILTGRSFTGQQALHLGLANEALPDELVEAAAGEVVKRADNLSCVAIAMAKKAFYTWDALRFSEGLDRAEKIYLEELMQTEDAREGIQAWLEKRSPTWKGK